MYGYFPWKKVRRLKEIISIFFRRAKEEINFLKMTIIRDKPHEAGNAIFSHNDPNHFNSMQFIYSIQCCCLAATWLVKLIRGCYQNDTRCVRRGGYYSYHFIRVYVAKKRTTWKGERVRTFGENNSARVLSPRCCNSI